MGRSADRRRSMYQYPRPAQRVSAGNAGTSVRGGEAALYFGELDLLQHVTFLGQEAPYMREIST